MDGMRRLGGRRLQSGATASYVRGLSTRGCTGEFYEFAPEELPGPKRTVWKPSGGEQVRNYQIQFQNYWMKNRRVSNKTSWFFDLLDTYSWRKSPPKKPSRWRHPSDDSYWKAILFQCEEKTHRKLGEILASRLSTEVFVLVKAAFWHGFFKLLEIKFHHHDFHPLLFQRKKFCQKKTHRPFFFHFMAMNQLEHHHLKNNSREWKLGRLSFSESPPPPLEKKTNTW